MDRLRRDDAQTADTADAATTDESVASSTRFTNQGAIPPVATAEASGPAAPSASERAFGPVGGFFKHVGQEAEVIGAEAVGVAELAGLRYPVKPYHAQVDAGLYRGSRLDDAGMAALAQMGIKAVVNLCLENNDDAARAAKYGLKALHVPILDNSTPTIAQMNQFIGFATSNPPTYVHCEAGKGRTGTAVACYRIAVDGWTADRAIAEGESFGLSLINQIAFIRKFAASRGAGPGAEPADSPAPEPRQTSDAE
jgi:hypothetical protein